MQIASMSEVKLSLRTDKKKHFVNDKKIGKQLCILHLNSSIIYEYSHCVSFKSPRSSSKKRLIVVHVSSDAGAKTFTCIILQVSSFVVFLQTKINVNYLSNSQAFNSSVLATR